MADLAQLEESIVGLSLLEAAELVKKLESRLGVSAARLDRGRRLNGLNRCNGSGSRDGL